MIALILALALGSQSPLTKPISHVDLIELNHYHPGGRDKEAFTQVIFWRFDHLRSRMHVAGWEIIQKGKPYPFRRRSGYYQYDTEKKRLMSRSFLETWTPTDPERENSKVLPDKYRLAP